MPLIAGALVSYLINKDHKDDIKRGEITKLAASRIFNKRFFVLKKPPIILCYKHVSHLKAKQIALIDTRRCHICVDNRGKL